MTDIITSRKLAMDETLSMTGATIKKPYKPTEFHLPDLNISTISLNFTKQLLVEGSRKEFRVLKLIKDESCGSDLPTRYSSIDEVLQYTSRKRRSLDFGIYDVEWNPCKHQCTILSC
jgi:hypothetical protein